MGQGFSLKTVGSPVQLIRELKRGVLLEYYINLWELKLDIMIQIRSRGFQQNKKNVMFTHVTTKDITGEWFKIFV